MTRTISLGLATVVALALGATPALAVDETKPTPCAGVLFTDPAGDQQRIPLAIGATSNMDITSVFVTKKADVTSLNIVVTNLDKSMPPTALGGVDWLIYFTVGETVAYLRASTNGTDVTYEHGIDDPTNGLTPGGATSGAFFEGPDGVIQMDLPETYADQELKNVYANSAVNQFAVVAYADSAPDGQEGPNVTPVSCDPPAPPAVPAAGGAKSAPTSLPLSLPSSAGSAKKANKARKLKLKVKAKQAMSSVRLTLKKGKTTIASGSAKSLSGTKTLTLKLKRNAKLKKGTYVLQASAKVDGKTLRTSRKVRASS